MSQQVLEITSCIVVADAERSPVPLPVPGLEQASGFNLLLCCSVLCLQWVPLPVSGSLSPLVYSEHQSLTLHHLSLAMGRAAFSPQSHCRIC